MNTSSNWFDTEYYHLLYKNRDQREAEGFIDLLVKFLEIKKEAKVLDLACGKGRHSIYLNNLGYDVLGVDLSQNSIQYAKNLENETLHFLQHDIRDSLGQTFDVVFNFFTSFGYFKENLENQMVVDNIASSLGTKGVAVIDFINVEPVIENLVKKEIKTVEGLQFNITRYVENNAIIKTIELCRNGKNMRYQEFIKIWRQEDFVSAFKRHNIELYCTFGDYKLNPFNKKTSERLILIFKK